MSKRFYVTLRCMYCWTDFNYRVSAKTYERARPGQNIMDIECLWCKKDAVFECVRLGKTQRKMYLN